MTRALKEYAKTILSDHNVDLYAYYGVSKDSIIAELSFVYPNGMKYSYEDVADAILAISKPKKWEKKAKWKCVFDGGSFVDAVDCDTLAKAKEEAIATYDLWMAEEATSWKNNIPSEEERDKWNSMIMDCASWVEKLGDDGEYHEYWFVPQKELEKMGWNLIE